MTEQLKEIGQRLKALREILDISVSSMCEKCGITEEELSAYEKGKHDFSFSFLYNAAGTLGVDVVDLMSGESPKLDTACIVRKGGGYDIKRRHEYEYKHLAFTFRNKKAEPFMVTVEPEGKEPEPHEHEGQEFNYVVEGSIQLYHGSTSYILEEGDSIYFDSSIPHTMKALNNKTARFLAVVMK